jgi:hypothetical protein
MGHRRFGTGSPLVIPVNQITAALGGNHLRLGESHDARLNALNFQPGFRLSTVDGFVLLAGSIGAALASSAMPWIGILVALVVGHFFLFCNVLRMRRGLELIWAATFVVLTMLGAIYFWHPFALLAGVVILTLTLCMFQLKDPMYHGAGWRVINPNLESRWKGAEQ